VFVALVEAARFLGGHLFVLSGSKLTHNQVTDCDRALHADEYFILPIFKWRCVTMLYSWINYPARLLFG
jgi:hypothetical protein